MKPILFESTETSFISNGLGRIDALSCQVTEARNGQYDLEMVVSIDDEHYGDIKEGRILYVRHDETQDKQPFDIYYISRPLDGKVTVLAQHVSYRTGKITVNPFTASSIALAFTQMKSQSIGNNPFNFWTDKVANRTFNVTQPKTIRQLLAGEQGSILDVYGTGEYEWDKWTIKLHLQRGTDSGVVLRYGKDITELTKTTDTSSVWTGVVPYWYGAPQSDLESEGEIEGKIEEEIGGEIGGERASSEEVLVMLPEKCIMADNTSIFGDNLIVPLDMTSYFEDVPTEAQLRQAAQAYVRNNAVSGIPTTIEFSFINLAALDEYKNVAALQRLKLCDTVTVVYDKLGVSNTKKIIQTVFDVLTEKYVGMTVGDTASNLASTLIDGIRASVDQLKTDTQRSIATTRSKLETIFQQTVAEQTDLITGGSGGHVVIKRDGDGKPTDILIMDNEDVNHAVQILRLNVNGIGFSSHGINGPYASAWTLDGQFNADFITTGELNAVLVKVGTLTDVNGNNSWNMETGDLQMTSGSIDIGNGKFSVNTNGIMSCQGASIQGSFLTGGMFDSYDGYYLKIDSAGQTIATNDKTERVKSYFSRSISGDGEHTWYVYHTKTSNDTDYTVECVSDTNHIASIELRTGTSASGSTTYSSAVWINGDSISFGGDNPLGGSRAKEISIAAYSLKVNGSTTPSGTYTLSNVTSITVANGIITSIS